MIMMMKQWWFSFKDLILPFFRCSLPKAMSISRSEIFRKKRKEKKRGTENEKIIGDHRGQWDVTGGQWEVMGGQ